MPTWYVNDPKRPSSFEDDPVIVEWYGTKAERRKLEAEWEKLHAPKVPAWVERAAAKAAPVEIPRPVPRRRIRKAPPTGASTRATLERALRKRGK